jgi:hypothetical protein
MKQVSLQHIMNEIVRRMEADASAATGEKPLDPWGLVDRYMSVDPVLAQLYKLYLEARASRTRVTALHGAKSPMAEVAATWVQSAEIALHRRLCDLPAGERALIFRDAAFQRSEKCAAAVRARRNEGADRFFLLYYWLFLFRNMASDAQRHLAAAPAFARAAFAGSRAAVA